MSPRVTVVIITRDRQASLMRTLDRLAELPERPPVVVVDNGSSDGTTALARARHRDICIVQLAENLAAAGRNIGVEAANTPYVAFSDDDSWWAPGSLAHAADLLDRHPTVAVLAARMLVGAEERLDPVCELMATSPLPTSTDLPGPAILGFVACGAVVRREAFLAVGGFDLRFGVGGEEELLTLDLASAGWALTYTPELVAHHNPSPARDPIGRRRVEARNALWVAWLRLPALLALRRTSAVLCAYRGDTGGRKGIAEAVRRVREVRRDRAVIPPALARLCRSVDRAGSTMASPGKD